MREERLLERIGSESDEYRRGAIREEDLAITSVVSYLNKILNTRRGSVLMDPEFGIPDYSGMASRFSTANTETVDDIESSIRTAIDKYEPRIKSQRVRLLDKDEFEFSLSIEVEAQLKTAQGNLPVMLKIKMGPDGQVTVNA